jgi:Platelet-activating factor acetylhydrolase, isoform II
MERKATEHEQSMKTRRRRVCAALIAFSHGIGGSRRDYSYLGRHWASKGYASLHVQHVGSDNALWSGNPSVSSAVCTLQRRLTRRSTV